MTNHTFKINRRVGEISYIVSCSKCKKEQLHNSKTKETIPMTKSTKKWVDSMENSLSKYLVFENNLSDIQNEMITEDN